MGSGWWIVDSRGIVGYSVDLSMAYLQCCINNLLNNFMVLSLLGLALRIRTAGFVRTQQL